MPISATPVAPPARARKTPTRAPVQAPADKTQARAEALGGIGKITSLILAMRGSYADAGAIAQHGPGICQETAKLAENDERIASWIDYLNEAGPYMGLVMAVMPLAMQIAANHGKLDATKLPPEAGVFPPEVLESRVKADMERTRLMFLQAAHESQVEAENTARALADAMRDHAEASANGARLCMAS